MSQVPDGLHYTKEHEWLKVEGGNARVGITDHAQHELTEIVYVELPKMGKKGWLAIVKMTDPGEVKGLMDATSYKRSIEE
jgi:glycine cleavage system H lipoate-binding protein